MRRPTPIYVFREEEARKVLPWLVLAWAIIIAAGVTMCAAIGPAPTTGAPALELATLEARGEPRVLTRAYYAGTASPNLCLATALGSRNAPPSELR